MVYRGLGRFQELNEKLLALEERLQRRNQLQRRLLRAEELLGERRAELEARGEELAQEREDVRRIEAGGLTALLARLSGGYEGRLERERAEALAAELRRDECRAEVDALVAEVAGIRREIESLGEIRAEQRELLRAKERLVASGEDVTARQLAAYDQALAAPRERAREVDEAIDAASKARVPLFRALELLDVLTISDLDLFLDSVLVSGKRFDADELARVTARAQSFLLTLHCELADLAIPYRVPCVRSEPFSILIEELVRRPTTSSRLELGERLRRTRERIAEASAEVDALLEDLELARGSCAEEGERIQRERRRLLDAL